MRRPNPLVQLTLARFREFIRQPEAIFWVFVFPILMSVGMGLAFRNRAEQTVRVAVQRNQGADSLADRLRSAPGLKALVLDSAEASRRLRIGEVGLVIVPGEPLVYRYDSTREESQLARLATDDAVQRAFGRTDPRAVVDRRVAERGHRYIDFFLPGLLGMNLMGTGMWGVGFAVVQMRVRRLLKRYLASPMRKSHFLLAFAFARLATVTLEVLTLVGFGILAFQVPFRGSVPALAVVVLVGAFAFSGLGMLVASRAQTVEGVSGLMNTVMLPMWVMSGVFFASSNFPDTLQPVIQALPLTALNDMLRAVMIDGAPLYTQGGELAVVGAWGAGSFAVALRIFRWL